MYNELGDRVTSLYDLNGLAVEQKYVDEMVDQVSGCCILPDFEEKWHVDELEALAYLSAHYEIEQCAVCGWWLYTGDYCSMHDHDEIVCTDCCEEE